MYKNSITLNQIHTTKEDLEKLYVIERKSTRQIAKHFGTSQPTARKLLRTFGIKIRDCLDREPARPKGSHLSENHKAAISKALIGNKNNFDPKTGKHWNYQRQEVQCAYCKIIFIQTKAHFNRVKNHYCSQKCTGEARKGRFIGKNSPSFNSEEKKCDNPECNNLIFVTPSRKKKTKRQFCCRECDGIYKSRFLVGEKIYNFSGGYEGYYGPNWEFQRNIARKRDKFICQRCGITENKLGKQLDVNHIIPFGIFGLYRYLEANHEENLISYCNYCHTFMDNFFKKALACAGRLKYAKKVSKEEFLDYLKNKKTPRFPCFNRSFKYSYRLKRKYICNVIV